MTQLDAITIQLPNSDQAFAAKLMSILSVFARQEDSALRFSVSDASFVPTISLEFANLIAPQVVFDLGDEAKTVPIANTTGQTRPPKLPFEPITIDDFMNRIKDWRLARLDHVGFNLPWFDDGVHPEVLKLRKLLAPASAYYLFPTGEHWDFILPANEQEIQSGNINLTKDRHPKFEIVSFDMTSTPLIQIDCAVRQPYELIKQTFPEGIPEDNLQDTWVAIRNPYGIDIFFVIGELKEKDWSPFFEGHRLEL